MGKLVERLYQRHQAKRQRFARAGFTFGPDPSTIDFYRYARRFGPPDPNRKPVNDAEIDRLLSIRRPTPDDSQRLLDALEDRGWEPVSGGSTASYEIFNAAMATIAAPVKQATGTAIRTMLQLKAATGFAFRVIEWGCSFDGSAAATPGQIELVETGQIGATSLSTAFATADIQTFGDPNATANTAGTSGTPFNLGTSASGFATGAVTEGSTTASRMGDVQLVAPTNQYIKQFPLGREFTAGYWGGNQNYLRIRMTFGVTVNTTCYVVCET